MNTQDEKYQNDNQVYENGQKIPDTKPKSKIAAGVLAIVIGSLGIHNFYLGYTTKGLVQILVSLIGGIFTCGISTLAIEIWALIEGIQILTGEIVTDAQGVPLE